MTAITINIPDRKVGFFKKLMAEMGLSCTVADEPVKAKVKKPRLYDPETGEYLNDETMKVIEDVRSGKEPLYHFDNFEDFKAWCEAL